MKNLIVLGAFLLFGSLSLQAQVEFELSSDQSMLMFGKGAGQDATINPYAGEGCYALVRNLGEVPFSIRIQQKGKIIETIPVQSAETKKVKLRVGHELYLDSESGSTARASVAYEKIPS